MEIWLRPAAMLLLVLLIGVAALAIAGLAYQQHAEATDRQRYPPPGRLVDIGGRRLHLLCAGRAPGAAVIIEAGSGDDSTLWEDMVRRISAFAHVCTYDRAGLGWSDPAPRPQSLDDRAADLRALLDAAGIAGPVVLVGHSYGGAIIRRFAANDPTRVAGMVLVDATEETWSFDPDGLPYSDAIGARAWRRGWLARFGVLRLGVRWFPDRVDPARGVPTAVHGLMTALALRSARYFAVADEMASYRRVPLPQRMRHGLGTLGDLPLAVVSRAARDPVSGAETDPGWQQAQANLAALSTRSIHLVAEKSGHVIQFSEPGLIVEAIRHVRAMTSSTP